MSKLINKFNIITVVIGIIAALLCGSYTHKVFAADTSQYTAIARVYARGTTCGGWDITLFETSDHEVWEWDGYIESDNVTLIMGNNGTPDYIYDDIIIDVIE